MRRKLPGYILLTLISFGFFTCIFHAVANAQAVEAVSPPNAAETAQLQPTPTVYVYQFHRAVTPTSSPQTPTPASTAPTNNPPSSPHSQPTQWINTFQASPTPITPTAAPLPTAAPTSLPATAPVADLESLFSKYSDEYHADKEQLKKIARCESGFNTTSNNSGIYLGMFQFSAGTWSSNRSRMGLDPNPDLRTNAEEAIKTAAFMLSLGQQGAWPNCH